MNARAAATMCSYQIWQDTATTLPRVGVHAQRDLAAESVRTAGAEPADVAAKRVALLVRAAAHADLRAEKPVGVQGAWSARITRPRTAPGRSSRARTQEQPTTNGYFSDSNSLSTSSGGGFFGPPSAFDPTGDICADASGNSVPCSTPGAVHVAGIPGAGLPDWRLHARAGGGQRHGAAVGVQPGARRDALPGAAVRPARLRPDPASRRCAPTPAASVAIEAVTRRCPTARRAAPRRPRISAPSTGTRPSSSGCPRRARCC